MSRAGAIAGAVAFVVAAAMAVPAWSSVGATTERVSVSSTEEPANGASDCAVGNQNALSADGMRVAFESEASNLSPNDTWGTGIFRRDRLAGITERADVSASGEEADADSKDFGISGNGSVVGFGSEARNLVHRSPEYAVYAHNFSRDWTKVVTRAADGTPAQDGGSRPSLSATGRYVAFNSPSPEFVEGDTNDASDVFVRDMKTGTTIRVSVSSSGREANDDSGFPSISADGRYVAFESYASNLVKDDPNGSWDVFVHDTWTGRTRAVTRSEVVGVYGASGLPSISATGRFVAFDSLAPDLVPKDDPDRLDVFVWDRVSGTISLVSVSSSGRQGNGNSLRPRISPDGRFVAFQSFASNLVPDDHNGYEDVFVHDLVSGKTRRVNLTPDGEEADGNVAGVCGISLDGTWVAFDSNASNLTQGGHAVFVRGPLTWPSA